MACYSTFIMKREDFQSERAGVLYPAPRGYWAYEPAPLPPQLSYSEPIARLLGEAALALGELAGLGRMLPNPHHLVGPAIRREAVLSSRIEGTETGMEDLLFFEAKPHEPPGKPDVKEVHNYVVALEYGLRRLDTLPVSLRLVRELHRHLLEGSRGRHAAPGEFRTTQNWIGPPGCNLHEATYVPPSEDRLPDVLGDWEAYVHAEHSDHALIRLAYIHYQFEAIHPFADGNGRVGRLLISLLLVHWGILPQPLLYLSAFFERYREDYYRLLLAVSQRGSWEAWVEFFLRGIREQSHEAIQSAKALIDLQTDYRNRLHGQRVTKITGGVLEGLFENPIIDTSRVRSRFHVHFNTAQRAIEELEGLGILTQITGRSRDRVWIAREILEVIAG